jgi:hypothetical protein
MEIAKAEQKFNLDNDGRKEEKRLPRFLKKETGYCFCVKKQNINRIKILDRKT